MKLKSKSLPTGVYGWMAFCEVLHEIKQKVQTNSQDCTVLEIIFKSLYDRISLFTELIVEAVVERMISIHSSPKSLT